MKIANLAEILLKKSNKALDAKNFELALDLCNQCIKTDSKMAQIYYVRGWVFFNFKKYDQAFEDFNTAINLGFTEAKVYDSRGIMAYRSRKINQAFFDFNKAIQLNPAYGSAYNSRGWALYVLKKYDQALDDFNTAINLKYNSFLGRANIYFIQQKYDLAIKDFTIFMSVSPNEIDLYQERGWAYFYYGNYECAYKDFDYAIKNNFKTSDCYEGRGKASFYLKKYEQSLLDFNEAIKLDSKNKEAYKGRGFIYHYYFKNHEAAIKELLLAKRNNFFAVDIRIVMAEAYFKLKKYRSVLTETKRAIKLETFLDKSSPIKIDTAYKLKAWANYYLANCKMGIKDFTKLIELEPENPENYTARALMYYAINDYKNYIIDSIHTINKTVKQRSNS